MKSSGLFYCAAENVVTLLQVSFSMAFNPISILHFVRNKYFVASLLFVVWMLFFDNRDWSLIRSRKQKLHELAESEAILSKKITDTRKELDMLRTDVGSLEKYAREKYYMKKDNEDVFIVK